MSPAGAVSLPGGPEGSLSDPHPRGAMPLLGPEIRLADGAGKVAGAQLPQPPPLPC